MNEIRSTWVTEHNRFPCLHFFFMQIKSQIRFNYGQKRKLAGLPHPVLLKEVKKYVIFKIYKLLFHSFEHMRKKTYGGVVSDEFHDIPERLSTPPEFVRLPIMNLNKKFQNSKSWWTQYGEINNKMPLDLDGTRWYSRVFEVIYYESELKIHKFKIADPISRQQIQKLK